MAVDVFERIVPGVMFSLFFLCLVTGIFGRLMGWSDPSAPTQKGGKWYCYNKYCGGLKSTNKFSKLKKQKRAMSVLMEIGASGDGAGAFERALTPANLRYLQELAENGGVAEDGLPPQGVVSYL